MLKKVSYRRRRPTSVWRTSPSHHARTEIEAPRGYFGRVVTPAEVATF